MQERCNHKKIPRHVIEEEIEELDEKPLCRFPSGNRSTRE